MSTFRKYSDTLAPILFYSIQVNKLKKQRAVVKEIRYPFFSAKVWSHRQYMGQDFPVVIEPLIKGKKK
jgi:hypothetical protein